MSFFKVEFKNENITAEVCDNTTLTDAARTVGIIVETPCMGEGRCGKCLADIDENGEIITVKACTYRIRRDITVYTRERQDDITVELASNKRADKYALLIDVGTTTIEMQLIADRDVICTASVVNPQTVYAGDIIGRIHIAGKSDMLKICVLNTINDMIEKITAAAAVCADNICECVCAGNTAMMYILLGINTQSLGKYPYEAECKLDTEIEASKCGINIAKSGRVYFPPIISAFIGADVVCGIACTELWKKDKILFADIGTNGEMLLADNGKILAASAAAGPAFEGLGITFGMRAETGAVKRFKITDTGIVNVETVGGAPAKVICGSGLLDIVKEFRRNGIIQSDGCFEKKENIAAPLRGRLREYEGEAAFNVCSGIYVTQTDIRQVQLAKSALRSGIEIMSHDAEKIIISGSFGTHASIDSLINIGLIPKRFANKITFASNTSLAGAAAFLANKELRKTVSDIAKTVNTVSFAENTEFEKLLVRHMNFE